MDERAEVRAELSSLLMTPVQLDDYIHSLESLVKAINDIDRVTYLQEEKYQGNGSEGL